MPGIRPQDGEIVSPASGGVRTLKLTAVALLHKLNCRGLQQYPGRESTHGYLKSTGLTVFSTR